MSETLGDSGRTPEPDLGRYRNMMCTWARDAGVAPDDASDIVQEAMLKAVKHGTELTRLNAQQQGAWLKTTTRRQAVDANRYQTRA